MSNTYTLERKLRRGMAKIVMHNPFFSMILLGQKLVYTDKIPTMGINGETLFVNLDFVEKLTPDEIIGVLVHECMHLCWNHVTRCGNRNPKLWNASCDYTINPIIKEEGFFLPTNHLDEERFHHMTADEIYKLLEKEQPEIDSDLLDIQPDAKQSKADRKRIEQKAKVNLAKAMQVAGDKAPAIIREMFEGQAEAVAPWESLLREFMQATLGNEDSTWRRPNRNHIHENIYLPSSEGHQLPNLAVMIDTSGSIYSNKELFNSFTSEINSIIEDLIPEQVDIYYVDTSIQKHDTYAEGEPPVYDMVGGGGTDFTQFFVEVEETNPACIIVFTDMYANGMPTSFGTDILWCCYGNDTPNENVHGKIIHLN